MSRRAQVRVAGLPTRREADGDPLDLRALAAEPAFGSLLDESINPLLRAGSDNALDEVALTEVDRPAAWAEPAGAACYTPCSVTRIRGLFRQGLDGRFSA